MTCIDRRREWRLGSLAASRRKATPLLLLLGLPLFIGAQSALAADDAREDRWAQEIVPSLVVGDPVYLSTPARTRVLAIRTQPSDKPKGGLVLVHGLGVHPDWGIVGYLRTALAEDGYVTLSVQMPVQSAAATADDYRDTLPDAGDRIAAALASLREMGVGPLAIVAHSMGATMTNAYLARSNATPIGAWVAIGMTGPFMAPPREPALDVVAERDLPAVRDSAPARMASLPQDGCSRQVTIPGADHYQEARRKDLDTVIAAFLQRALTGQCVMSNPTNRRP